MFSYYTVTWLTSYKYIKNTFPAILSCCKKKQGYDVIIIGGGHAGCEAALSCCSQGVSTLLFTLNLDKIAWQPCNPSVGGPAKSILVHEIDALGGWIGKITDRSYIHKKILNTSKGPAIWSLRAQTDKREYSEEMKKVLNETDNLTISEEMVSDIILTKEKKIKGVKTYFGGLFECKSVVITTGTFMKGVIWVGSKKFAAGRLGEMASFALSDSLKKLEFNINRLKTGTPPRIDSRYINFKVMEKQNSDIIENWFSFDSSEWNSRHTLSCYISHTTLETLSVIRNNLHLSPKYGGFMRSTGPRYCPSIEDKIVRFNQKKQHQVFLEPEGRNTNEVYIQGMSTGLPENLQKNIIKTIPGLEHSKIIRPAYSVDYDYILATQLDKTLMSDIPGLFFAGQICGTTGYEEAAAQGWIAGLNAGLYSSKNPLLSLRRESSFIGLLIDDLCTKKLKEPYRVLTSKSEHRLLLRGDNADFRLTPLGKRYGTISERKWTSFKHKYKNIQKEMIRIDNSSINKNLQQKLTFMENQLTTSRVKNCCILNLVDQPLSSYKTLENFRLHNFDLNVSERRQLEIEIKYAVYIERQEIQISILEEVLDTKIQRNLNFMKIFQISKEAREKLSKKRPSTLREACQLGGIGLSDIQALLVHVRV
nr:glucose inhibited division protein A [Cryptomonas paramecium]